MRISEISPPDNMPKPRKEISGIWLLEPGSSGIISAVLRESFISALVIAEAAGVAIINKNAIPNVKIPCFEAFINAITVSPVHLLEALTLGSSPNRHFGEGMPNVNAYESRGLRAPQCCLTAEFSE